MVSIYVIKYFVFQGTPGNGPARHPVLGTGLQTVAYRRISWRMPRVTLAHSLAHTKQPYLCLSLDDGVCRMMGISGFP